MRPVDHPAAPAGSSAAASEPMPARAEHGAPRGAEGACAADPAATALFLGAFFDELARWGVHDVVASPGSRSTPLVMTAYELARREPDRLRLFVDVDERGAAFFALGLTKASGRPAALVCTSGTAVGNYYPAVLEAESSRVPLVVLTGDRPPRLQGLGAPQTCDQLKAFGDHVRAFRQMPLPSADAAALALARQAAREAAIASGALQGSGPRADEPPIAGACLGGPVQLNFPFDEPLKPDFDVEGLFEAGARPPVACEPIVPVAKRLEPVAAERAAALLAGRRALVLAGEGTCATDAEARAVLAWARAFDLPLLADPLSGLRSFDDALVIDNYDSVLGAGGAASDELRPDAIVRFGRYPVSKKAVQFAAACLQVVVDPFETRDFNAATDAFAPCEPAAFARSLLATVDPARAASPRAAERARTPREAPDATGSALGGGASGDAAAAQRAFAEAWRAANDAAGRRIAAAERTETGFEGAFVRRTVELAPEGSCLFVANSMSIRALDTFYLKSCKRLTVLCNRGLNGIDGTVSAALGAAQSFAQTTLITGDLALLHDLNALALQRELRVQRHTAARGTAIGEGAAAERLATARDADRSASGGDAACTAHGFGGRAPSIVIVLLNNNGGGIFDMLPQQSDDPYFERLFLTPQDVDFGSAARAFGVPYRRADTIGAFDAAYRELLGVPGISLVEAVVPLSGLKERYAPYW